MRAARVTEVVPCVCVSVSVRSFLPPRASRPRNIGTYMFTATRKNFYNPVFLLKMLRSEDTASFSCLECNQLHLSSEIWTPTESAQRGHDIAIRDFN